MQKALQQAGRQQGQQAGASSEHGAAMARTCSRYRASATRPLNPCLLRTWLQPKSTSRDQSNNPPKGSAPLQPDPAAGPAGEETEKPVRGEQLEESALLGHKRGCSGCWKPQEIPSWGSPPPGWAAPQLVGGWQYPEGPGTAAIRALTNCPHHCLRPPLGPLRPSSP